MSKVGKIKRELLNQTAAAQVFAMHNSLRSSQPHPAALQAAALHAATDLAPHEAGANSFTEKQVPPRNVSNTPQGDIAKVGTPRKHRICAT